jgi:hypothetical protein
MTGPFMQLPIVMSGKLAVARADKKQTENKSDII